MNKIETYFRESTLLAWIFLFSMTLFVFYVIGFFMSLCSLVSDYSWGDIAYHHQIFYNFIHGQFFTTSVHWNALLYSGNQYAYLNMVNIHLYISPFIFSSLYALVPNLSGLYMTVVAVNYTSLAFFLWKLVGLFTSDNRFFKYLLLMSFILANVFIFSLVVAKASPILFGTPFILAAYYYLQKERYILYYIFAFLFCLSYDDSGLLFISFLLYVYFFEKQHIRPAVVTAVMGALTVGLIIGVIQPVARLSMPGKSVASVCDAFVALSDYLSNGHWFFFLKSMIVNLMLFALLFLIFPVISLWSPTSFRQRQDVYQYLGLIFLAPLFHWASMVVNIGSHFMPVVIFSVIAVTLAISRSKLTIPRTWTWQSRLAVALIGFYLAGNMLVFGYRQRHWVGSQYAAEKQANAHCLKQINHLVPRDQGLTYWAARGLDGFLSNRSNLWRFPDFFDQAAFLMMQKNGQKTFFQAKIRPGEDINQALRNGTRHTSGEEVGTDNNIIEIICNKLVKIDNSHLILYDDPNMVILKRKECFQLEQPPETRGFGFLNNFPRFWKTKFQRP